MSCDDEKLRKSQKKDEGMSKGYGESIGNLNNKTNNKQTANKKQTNIIENGYAWVHNNNIIE